MKKFYLGFILLVIISCNKQVDYSKDINELKSQISLLQGQIGGLRKTTDSLTNELKGINTQVSEVSRKVDSILNRITVINTQLIDLNSQLTKNSTDITGLLKKIEDLQIELVNLTKLIQDLKYQQVATSGYEVVPVDQRLKSTNKGVITIPVVIVNYIPTSDGIYLDKNLTLGSTIPWDEAHKYLLSRAKNKILTDKIIEKNAIEESTKFRDYATNTVKPYIDIDVVAYINVYDVKYIKTGTRSVDTTDDNINNPVTIDWYRLDYKDIASRINLGDYVDNKGVKDVWLTTFPKEAGYLSFNVPESNMSPKNGATYYDVSNGGGDMNDLPRYNNTYVVYGDNGFRGVDTDLHNRGHQLERQMMFIDNTLWSTKFAKVGRAGNTHWCPNSVKDYDYWNKTFVKSDIMTWKPSGGSFVDVNVDTWLTKKYGFENTISMISPGPFATGTIDYSVDAQVKWFIFWWQSVPGYNNGIIDGTTKVNNWWDIFYNWDTAIKNNTKLIY
jgi:uncharacterized protein YoxC